ncbi:MAG: GPW/gp25 family protein [Bacteroidota bacterium]
MARQNNLLDNKAFLGRGWKFPPEFNRAHRGTKLSQYEQDIRESLLILLSTLRGERVMRPSYGTTVYDLLFEPLDLNVGTLVSEEVKRAILVHEPRVFVDQVTPNQDPFAGFLELSIDYTVISTNTRYNLVYPFYLNEGTNAKP